MHPIKTDETTGTYVAPDGLEHRVGGLPYFRTMVDGIPEITSIWQLDADEKEAIALGGNVLVGIMGEPIPPIRLEVLSPIDVPAFGMEPLPVDDMRVPSSDFVSIDYHDGGLLRLAWFFAGLTVLAILVVGFVLGRLTA